MSRTRRGVAILETVVASGIIAVLITLCLQTFASMGIQRRAIEKRAIAQQVAANAIEQVIALPWEHITPERLAEIQLSPDLAEIFAGGTLKVTAEPSVSGPPSQHIRAEISWTQPGGNGAPVRLSYWRFAPVKEGSP